MSNISAFVDDPYAVWYAKVKGGYASFAKTSTTPEFIFSGRRSEMFSGSDNPLWACIGMPFYRKSNRLKPNMHINQGQQKFPARAKGCRVRLTVDLTGEAAY